MRSSGCAGHRSRCNVASVTPTLRAVYDELIERAAKPPFVDRAGAMRTEFLDRCGCMDSGEPEADYREAAAWEDVLVRGGLAKAIAENLDDPAEREVARSLSLAHRGLFEYFQLDGRLIARDLWSRAEFIVEPGDNIGREIAAADACADSPLCQARLVAGAEGCAMLPGAVFHPLEARAAVEDVLAAARKRQLPTDTVLDALLKMEHTWRTLSRVKVGYAYRPAALPGCSALP